MRKADIQKLKRMYPVMGIKVKKVLKDYTTQEIYDEVAKLRLSPTIKNRKIRWTDKELEILYRLYPKKRDNIPQLLKNRSHKAIYHRARGEGLTKGRPLPKERQIKRWKER